MKIANAEKKIKNPFTLCWLVLNWQWALQPTIVNY